jgi:NNP family nitrate/nitrite transporter-like MFS transporter
MSTLERSAPVVPRRPLLRGGCTIRSAKRAKTRHGSWWEPPLTDAARALLLALAMHTPPDPRTGHRPTLVACFLHFDLSFMLWVLIGALGIYIADGLALNAAQKGLVVAVPILTGSLLRIPLGLLSDRIGGKRVGLGILGFLIVPLLFGWLGGENLGAVLLVGATLGVAGASFAVVLPLASKWYPAERQGLVMGIAAAGNSGTVIANLFAPRLANLVGWHNVFGLALIPLAAVLTIFALAAKDTPRDSTTPAAGFLKMLQAGVAHSDLWWFCFFYCVTFGGYVGLSSFLPLFVRDHFGVSPVTAGYLTALAAFVGSGVRPLGGYLADRVGGVRVLAILLAGVALLYAAIGTLPSLVVAETMFVALMSCLGMGNGAVFQLVPQRFRDQIGMATGVVGAIGGLGGFLLPTLLGSLKQTTGSFASGFFVLAIVAATAALSLQALVAFRSGWRLSWTVASMAEAFD